MITQVGLQGLGTVSHQPSGGVALMNATCPWGQERRPMGTWAPAPAPSLEVGDWACLQTAWVLGLLPGAGFKLAGLSWGRDSQEG